MSVMILCECVRIYILRSMLLYGNLTRLHSLTKLSND